MVHSFPNGLTLNLRPKPPLNPAADAAVLALDGVTFGYTPSRPLLQDFSWTVRDGESWSILGPSGSGKTTLLYLLAGLRKPTGGSVTYRGQRISQPLPEVGLMLQDYGLLPWFTARQNVEIGLKMRGMAAADRRRIAESWLAQLEISHTADQYPGQLSGGQRQRVALARLLALDARVLLLDEPFAAVDELTRERLQKRLWTLRRDIGAASVLVTHNVEEAAMLGSRIMVITGYAPITGAAVLHSPFNGDLPQRDDPAFIHFCAEIRSVLQL